MSGGKTGKPTKSSIVVNHMADKRDFESGWFVCARNLCAALSYGAVYIYINLKKMQTKR